MGMEIDYSGTTPEQQAFYAPIAHEMMRQPDFHGMSYEHLLVEYERRVAEIRQLERRIERLGGE